MTTIRAGTSGQPSLAVGPRHQHNGDTCDSANTPIGRFRGSAKAPFATDREALACAGRECHIGYGSPVAVNEDWIEIDGLPA